MMEINRKILKDFASEIEWNSKIRSVIYLICCGVMLYQVISSCIDYYDYKTVVQIRIGKSDKMEMPSISVCKKIKTGEYLDMLKAKDPEFAAKYPKLLSSEKSDEFVENTADVEAEAESSALEVIAHYFDDEKKDVLTFFDIVKASLNVKCTDILGHTPVDCEDRAKRINSFTQRRICVTFFSKLYINFLKNESNFNISENFTQKLDSQESMFAWLRVENPDDDVFIYIHTSNSMPGISLYDLEMSRSRLFKNKTYGIIYTKYFVNRLEHPYSTDCYNYTKKRKLPDDPLSEFGCIERCKKKYWKNKTYDKCLPIDLVFVMESDDRFEEICNCTVKPCDVTLNKCEKCREADSEQYKKWSTDCENNCKQDCYEEYYEKDKFELKEDFEQELFKKFNIESEGISINSSIIFLAATYKEEISYTHIPKMNSFDFFASMGGLFSLWIGASVLTIYDLIYGLFKFGKFFKKRAFEEKLFMLKITNHWKTNYSPDRESRTCNRRSKWQEHYSLFRPRAGLTKYHY